MSQRRYTVVHSPDYIDQLADLYLSNPDVQRSMDELDPVLRTIPDLAGYPLYHQDAQLWRIEHRAIEIQYEIVDEDRQVQLISIQLARPPQDTMGGGMSAQRTL